MEAQIQAKFDADQKRRAIEDEEDEKVLKKIHIQREKERKAYLQEIAAIEKQNKVKFTSVKAISASFSVSFYKQDDTRKRQQEIARRLEDIQIEEAKQRDEAAARQKRILLELMYNRDFSEPRSSLSSYYFRRPWNWTHRDYTTWFNSWQTSIQEIFLSAPIPEVTELSRKLDAERVKLHEIMRQRIARGD